jgi:DNA-binding HxlR family transcriptional regulator
MAGTDDGIVSGDIDRGMRDAGRWSLLILRECFLRVRRFEEFQSRLGITRHLLADRLKKFVRYGVCDGPATRKARPGTNTS